MARRSSVESRKRILSSCAKLFIEKGYNETTMAEIIEDAGVSNSTFQNLFHSKSGVLIDMIKFTFSAQFQNARKLSADREQSAFIYAIDTAVQMTITELNENIREIYLEAYTYPETAEYIFQSTSSELYYIFGKYRPELDESDFYELEIGTSGIMRNYMAKRCDKYFTLEKKILRFLEITLTIYGVSKEEQDEIIKYITNVDIKNLANKVMNELLEALAVKFDFELVEREDEI